MNDTQRIDALSNHGLCVVQLMELKDGNWSVRWVCHFGIDQKTEGATVREAIDQALEAIGGISYAAQKGIEQESNQL